MKLKNNKTFTNKARKKIQKSNNKDQIEKNNI